MKVRELIQDLLRFDMDDLIIVSIDPEGNGFYPIAETEQMVYDTSENNVYYRELTLDMEKQGYTKDDIRTEGEKCIVLWP